MFHFIEEREEALKQEHERLKDKQNRCSNCRIEKIHNQSEGFYVCLNCDECEFALFTVANNGDMPSRKAKQIYYRKMDHIKTR